MNEPSSPDSTEEQRSKLAREVMSIMEQWRLAVEDQKSLLGLNEKGAGRALAKYRSGYAMPDDELLLERCRHIIGIHNSFHLLYPRNPNAPRQWLKTKNRHFAPSPLAVMLDEGINGMRRVWHNLDCTSQW